MARNARSRTEAGSTDQGQTDRNRLLAAAGVFTLRGKPVHSSADAKNSGATLEVEDRNPPYYRNKDTGEVFPFSPGMRYRAGPDDILEPWYEPPKDPVLTPEDIEDMVTLRTATTPSELQRAMEEVDARRKKRQASSAPTEQMAREMALAEEAVKKQAADLARMLGEPQTDTFVNPK